jgi:hypothetical protein
MSPSLLLINRRQSTADDDISRPNPPAVAGTSFQTISRWFSARCE